MRRLRTIKATLAYDGTDFLGWQIQAEGRTVQGEVMAALERMHRHEVRVLAAGRTDAGVHADGQVISFRTELDSITSDRYFVALNSYLPRDVKAVRSEEVGEEFHARYDARRRVYRYTLDCGEIDHPRTRRYALRLRHAPNVSRLNAMARQVVGTHDFTTFSLPKSDRTNRRRTVYAAGFYPAGRFLVFQIEANAYLWRMVRSLVGTMLDLDKQGAEPVEVIDRLEAHDHARAGPSAPACGLSLYRVDYDDEQAATVDDP